MTYRRRYWTDDEIWRFIAAYADTSNDELSRQFHRSYQSICGMAANLGLEKSAEYLATIPAKTGMIDAGRWHRFPKGHVPANKGLRRPGYYSGRMRETQFKKGQVPHNSHPDFHVIGALRVNSDGYLDMRVSFKQGALGWRALHRILWEDAHGPVPAGHCLRFKDGDKLNVCLENIRLVSQRANMLLNSIEHIPQPLRNTIKLLGQLKRKIREKQNRGSAGSPVRHA